MIMSLTVARCEKPANTGKSLSEARWKFGYPTRSDPRHHGKFPTAAASDVVSRSHNARRDLSGSFKIDRPAVYRKSHLRK